MCHILHIINNIKSLQRVTQVVISQTAKAKVIGEKIHRLVIPYQNVGLCAMYFSDHHLCFCTTHHINGYRKLGMQIIIPLNTLLEFLYYSLLFKLSLTFE